MKSCTILSTVLIIASISTPTSAQASCKKDNNCPSTQYCNTARNTVGYQTCLNDLAGGSPCDRNAMCRTGVCSNSRCTYPPSPPPPPSPSPSPSPIVEPTYGPLSAVCRDFPLAAGAKYTRVNTLSAMRTAIASANPGDMIELEPGMYYMSTSPVTGAAAFDNPRRGRTSCLESTSYNTRKPTDLTSDSPEILVPNTCSRNFLPDAYVAPSTDTRVRTSGDVYQKSGTAANPITICGPQNAIIDGTDTTSYKFQCFSIIKSKYIRLAGITMQWCMKPIDVQDSSYIDIYKVRTRFSLQEGIRLRYNTHHCMVRSSIIEYAGYCYSGEGEGIYIGTSRDNSVNMVPAEPQDKTNYNLIVGNTFRTGITAEPIDVKEFTEYGQICGNYLSGDAISGVNGATSQIVIKGNNWNVGGSNKGVGGISNGCVYRTSNQYAGWGNYNTIKVDTCEAASSAKACVYLATDTNNNAVDSICMINMGSVPVCNGCGASQSCPANTGRKMMSVDLSGSSSINPITGKPLPNQAQALFKIPEIEEMAMKERNFRSGETDDE